MALDMHAGGGIIVCAGADYSGTFQNCTFKETRLCIVHGAKAHLRHCAFTGAPFAVVASSRGTAVTLRECALVRCGCGVIAEDGATLHAHSVRFDSVFRAVHVHGDAGPAAAHACHPEETRAEFCHCDFSYKPHSNLRSAYPGGDRAFRVFRGALSLHRCSISWYI